MKNEQINLKDLVHQNTPFGLKYPIKRSKQRSYAYTQILTDYAKDTGGDIECSISTQLLYDPKTCEQVKNFYQNEARAYGDFGYYPKTRLDHFNPNHYQLKRTGKKYSGVKYAQNPEYVDTETGRHYVCAKKVDGGFGWYEVEPITWQINPVSYDMRTHASILGSFYASQSVKPFDEKDSAYLTFFPELKHVHSNTKGNSKIEDKFIHDKLMWKNQTYIDNRFMNEALVYAPELDKIFQRNPEFKKQVKLSKFSLKEKLAPILKFDDMEK